MHTSQFKKLTILLLVAIAMAATAVTGQEAEKKFEKVFPVTGQASLELENRYGKVDIRNWERDEISIEVLVKVSHTSKENAERQLSYININFSQRENAVKAVTEIDQRISRTGSRWFSSGNDGVSIDIDYMVYTPKDTDLRVTHRYGDIFINEATGHTYIDLRYGNLQANRIIRDNTRPLSEINLAYSPKATITHADWLQVNMRYSDLVVDQCRALVLSSSYSKIRVERASSIVTESRYGEFNLGNITNFVAESAYTNFSIGRIGSTIDIESRYGNVRVDNMPSGFSKIRFVGSYGNMRIGIDPGASYRIESTASYGSVSIPQGGRVNRISRGTQSTLSGVVGNNSEPEAFVDISTRYGNVDLTSR